MPANESGGFRRFFAILSSQGWQYHEFGVHTMILSALCSSAPQRALQMLSDTLHEKLCCETLAVPDLVSESCVSKESWLEV